MNCLNTINGLNAKAASKDLREKNSENPHCSYAGDASDGIVLCNAFGRQTQFISAGAGSNNFLAKYTAANSADAKDNVINSYFKY